MKIDTSNLLNSIQENLANVDFLTSSDIPNIDLYMDQVTSFMEKELASTKRSEEDKILTKTMINNYAKGNLLPAPIKKKYSKEHLLVLIFIYYFKNILTMKDIETLLTPITDKYFHTDSDITIADIYDEIYNFKDEHNDIIQKDILAMYEQSTKVFLDVADEERESLQLFSLICTLCLDVYVKKMLIESLIDQIPSKKEEEPTKEKKKKEKEK